MIIWDERISAWVAANIPQRPDDFGSCRSMGVFKAGKIIGGVVYHDWNAKAETIQLSAAATSPKWTTRQVIAEIWGYPFSFCQMAWAQHSPDNPARAIWKKLGADETEIPHMFGRDKPAIVSTLTSDAWKRTRFAELHHG